MAKLLTNWNPEDSTKWGQAERQIARRNLWISVPALLLSFAIWQVWSVTVVKLPSIGFIYTDNQLFWLAALPALSGATLRFFYSFVIPIFGGRRWTAFSTASLMIPAFGLGLCVQNPDTSYLTMLILALLCGFGGANFSSSMANISYFFPKKEKGNALGINAGLGNLGVSVVQFVVPLIITAGVFGIFGGQPQTVLAADNSTQTIWLQNAGFIWLPFIFLNAMAAWFGMNDIDNIKASLADQRIIFKRLHTWLMTWLYIGTFGSFIGFSAAFPLLINKSFPTEVANKYIFLAFLAPLTSAICRVIGGWLSDKISAAKISQVSFLVMIVAVMGVIYFLPHANGNGSYVGGNFAGFFVCFMLLFAFTGIGNGSTFAQTPIVFALFHARVTTDSDVNHKNAMKETATALGLMGSIGAFGGFLIPKSFGTSLALTGSAKMALIGFIVFYLTCCVINYYYYLRANSATKC